MSVEHPGGGHVERRALLRYVETARTALLYPGMLHLGSVVRLALPEHRGGLLKAAGHTAACVHIRGSWHDITLDFIEPVNVSKLLASGIVISADANAGPSARRLDAAAAVLGACDLDAKVIAHLLSLCGVTARAVSTAGELMDLVTSSDVDLVVAEAAGLERGPDEAARALLRAGLRAGIIFLVPDGSVAAFADEIPGLRVVTIQRPATAELLADAAAMVLRDAGALAPDEASVRSTLTGEGVERLVGEYLETLRLELDTLAAARAAGNVAAARTVLAAWRDSAATFGFAALTMAARHALKALDASGSLDESAPEVRRAVSLGRRILAAAERPPQAHAHATAATTGAAPAPAAGETLRQAA